MLNKMSSILQDFSRRESLVDGTMGIVVFGSFVRGEVKKSSDLDLLVVNSLLKECSRSIDWIFDVPLDINRWPLSLFSKPFTGRPTNVFSDAFCFATMRSGKIIHDPEGILVEFREHSRTNKLPQLHIISLVNYAEKCLNLAQGHIKKRKLEKAEVETRKASEELGRALLIDENVVEIIPPKIYLPFLRKKNPYYYRFFREIQNLEENPKNQILTNFQYLINWFEESYSDSEQLWRKKGISGQNRTISVAKIEIMNAQNCLEDEDLDAAIMQLRYSASILLSLKPDNSIGHRDLGRLTRIKNFKFQNNCYNLSNIFTEIMGFRKNKRIIEEHIEILREIAKRYNKDRDRINRV